MKDINTEALKQPSDHEEFEKWWRDRFCVPDYIALNWDELSQSDEIRFEAFCAGRTSPPVADISGQEGEREAFERRFEDVHDMKKWTGSGNREGQYVDPNANAAWAAWKARAALPQPPAVQVPEGYKLVPEAETPEWRERLDDIGYSHSTVIRDVLAAAPSPAVTDTNMQADEPHDCSGIEKLRERLGRCDHGRLMLVHPAILTGLFSSLDGAHAVLDSERAFADAGEHEIVRRKAFICTSCEFAYADEPVTKCDCMPDEDEFIEGVITYPAALSQPPATQKPIAYLVHAKRPGRWREFASLPGYALEPGETLIREVPLGPMVATDAQPPAVQVPDVSLIDEGNIHAAKGGD